MLGTLLIFVGAALGGCDVIRKINPFTSHAGPGTTTTTTTTVTKTTRTTHSDVAVAGHPVTTPTPAPKQVARHGGKAKNPSPTPTPKQGTSPATQGKAKGPATPEKAAKPAGGGSAAQTTFPKAKRVPDKPGYVVSPFDSKGRYVDVSGYTSGSRVKDPWTGKLFIVP